MSGSVAVKERRNDFLSDSAAVKKKKNDSLSDTIRHLNSGFLPITEDPTVKEEVERDEMDS